MIPRSQPRHEFVILRSSDRKRWDYRADRSSRGASASFARSLRAISLTEIAFGSSRRSFLGGRCIRDLQILVRRSECTDISSAPKRQCQYSNRGRQPAAPSGRRSKKCQTVQKSSPGENEVSDTRTILPSLRLNTETPGSGTLSRL